MPPSIALATRGRLQGLRLQLALLDREFDDLDYETLRALDSENVPTTPSLSEEEINALPMHKYKVAGTQSGGSSMQQGSSSASTDKKQDINNAVASTKAPDDELTCSVCLEQDNVGELTRNSPCLHQFYANCIDPWMRQFLWHLQDPFSFSSLACMATFGGPFRKPTCFTPIFPCLVFKNWF